MASHIPRTKLKNVGVEERRPPSLDFAKDGAIAIRRTRGKCSLEELVAGIKPKNRHVEVDWDKPRGKEVW